MSLDDERVRFYLRNRDRIEEWAALRAEAAAAIDEWLFELRPAVEDLAQGFGSDVRVDVIDEGGFAYPSYRLVRTSWPEDPSIALE